MTSISLYFSILFPILTIISAKKHHENRIINGWQASEGLYKYYAFIYINSDPYCGGTIIKENLILSAASTMRGVTYSTLRIYPGMMKLSDAQTITPYYVNRIETHPNYRPGYSDFDIAIVFLTSSLTFNTKVNKIDLSQVMYPVNYIVTVCGFGLTNCNQKVYDQSLGVYKCTGGASEYLRVAYMNIKQYIGSDTMVTNYTFNGVTSCFGDFGGPVVYDNVLVGVQSLIQNPNCTGDSYQASIPPVYSWISGYM